MKMRKLMIVAGAASALLALASCGSKSGTKDDSKQSSVSSTASSSQEVTSSKSEATSVSSEASATKSEATSTSILESKTSSEIESLTSSLATQSAISSVSSEASTLPYSISTSTSSSTVSSSTTTSSSSSSKSSTTSSMTSSTTSSMTSSISSSVTPSSSSTKTQATVFTESNGAQTGEIEGGAGEVKEEGQITVQSVSGLFESGYVIYEKVASASSYNIYVDGVLADSKLAYTREVSQTQMRTDLVGLTAGKHTIKLAAVEGTTESTAKMTSTEMTVVENDRSGYAHFNYTNGVGAYNDDGTIKKNAIVLYVSDANKNTVELSYKGTTVTGIGNILNTAGKKCGESGHENDCKKISSGKTYYGKGNENQGILMKLAQDNIPLAVRLVGVVSESGLGKPGTYSAADAGQIDGLTEYDSNDYGGSEGDNGHMARMKSAKDVTIEGVGYDAAMDGWGVHFMAESAAPTLGKSFEVRNIAFYNNPEDAIGMEGVQESGKITASVERCWVHNNTFLKPSISQPAESDKAQGDGSCDFKRGMYFTLAYNYFEYCHKTNLIGSSDSSLQYNISFHHNTWYNCGSRIPLLRQANIHFYNNYIYGDSNDKEGALSYVTSLRANSYMYSENNYYEGCKAPTSDTGGACKMYGNAMIQCFNGNTATVASSREQQVASNCAYNGVSYANFDTNSSLFYYDSVNKVSDCYLTSAAVARQECIKYSGSYYRTVLDKTTLSVKTTDFVQNVPTSAVKVGSSVKLPTAKGSSTVDNVVWSNVTGYTSTEAKIRGQGASFKLDKYATVTIQGSAGSTAALAQFSLVGNDGTVYLNGAGSVVLAPGVYTICSCQKDKDSIITSISFAEYDSDALKAQLIENYNNAYQNLPATISYTNECYQLVNAAMEAYNALGTYKSEVSTSPTAKFEEYIQAGQVYVEGLISAIGTVDENSGNAISSARNAYNKLISQSATATVSNYSTLTAAETTYKSFAVQGTINQINAIGEVTLAKADLIAAARTSYEALDSEQHKLVTNVSVLIAAEAKLKNLQNAATVEALITATDTSSLDSMKATIDAYNALTADEKTLVSNANLVSSYKVTYTITAINQISDTVTAQDAQAIALADAMYQTLDSTEKAAVTNSAKLEAAKTAIKSVSLAAKDVTLANFDITGATTAGTMNGSLKSGDEMIAVSQNAISTVSKVTLTVSVEDKSTTPFEVFVSTDGENWTSIGSKTASNNKPGQVLVYENTTGSSVVYVKIKATCSKSSAKSVEVTSVVIE